MNDHENSDFEFICKYSDLKELQGKRFIIGETEIAVFKINNEIYALNNICPHQHTALIYEGFIEDSCVVCPAHGWKFDLRTGRKPSGSQGLDSYKVKIADGDIFVQAIPEELNW